MHSGGGSLGEDGTCGLSPGGGTPGGVVSVV